MAVLDLSPLLWTGAGSGFGQVRYDLLARSDTSGTDQARLYGPPRWVMSLVQPALLTPEAGRAWQSLVVGLRGRGNHLKAWDVGRPQPLGTYRGSGVTLSSTVTAGDVSITLTGGVGLAARTLLAGDKFQIGTGVGTSQLVMVMADAVADGSGQITVQVEPPLRLGFTSGTAVTLQRPCAYFKQQATTGTWTYEQAAVPLITGMALDLLENWTP